MKTIATTAVPIAIYAFHKTWSGAHIQTKTEIFYTAIGREGETWEIEQPIEGLPMFSGSLETGGGKHDFYGADLSEVIRQVSTPSLKSLPSFPLLRKKEKERIEALQQRYNARLISSQSVGVGAWRIRFSPENNEFIREVDSWTNYSCATHDWQQKCKHNFSEEEKESAIYSRIVQPSTTSGWNALVIVQGVTWAMTFQEHRNLELSSPVALGSLSDPAEVKRGVQVTAQAGEGQVLVDRAGLCDRLRRGFHVSSWHDGMRWESQGLRGEPFATEDLAKADFEDFLRNLDRKGFCGKQGWVLV